MNVVRLARTSFPGPAPRTAPEERLRLQGAKHGYGGEPLRRGGQQGYALRGRRHERIPGLGRKHHLVPVEAVSEEDPGSMTLGVDQETVQRAPTFANPRVGANEEYPRTIREHYGYS